MLKIEKIRIKENCCTGCNNGTHDIVNIGINDNGTPCTWMGYTCKCGNGCHGTLNINAVSVGDTFDTSHELEEVLGWD